MSIFSYRLHALFHQGGFSTSASRSPCGRLCCRLCRHQIPVHVVAAPRHHLSLTAPDCCTPSPPPRLEPCMRVGERRHTRCNGRRTQRALHHHRVCAPSRTDDNNHSKHGAPTLRCALGCRDTGETYSIWYMVYVIEHRPPRTPPLFISSGRQLLRRCTCRERCCCYL